MRKLLGVSIVAMWAVAPMMADAAIAKLNAGAAGSTTDIATTSYVKGAYKAAADKIDAVIDDITTTDGQYSKAANSVGTNLKALDDQIKANADAITALGGGGNIASQISSGAQNGTFSATQASGLESVTIKDAINEVGAGLEDVKDDIATLNGDSSVPGSVDAKIATAVDAIDGALDLKQDKADSTVSPAALTTAGLTAGTDLNADEGVAANLIKVASKAKTNAGNINTINNKVINLVSDWTTNTIIPKKISELPDFGG